MSIWCCKKRRNSTSYQTNTGYKKLPSKEILVLQTIAGLGNEIATLEEKNKDIIKCLKEHIRELTMLSLTDENLYNTLMNLINDENLINLYLENARSLEYLQVRKIKFVKDIESINANGDRYICGFIPNRSKEGIQDRIKYILKYYTDGKVFPRLTEEVQSYEIPKALIKSNRDES